MSQPVTATDAPAGNDASFAATVVEELFIDAEESDSEPAVDPGDSTLQLLPTLARAGRYELKHQLGSGGLGTVYAALDPLLSRQVAVKMLKVADLQPDARSALESQLLAEARAAAGLAHPNIVTVYDAGLADGGGVYVAMERLRGKDVRQLLADGWRPDAVQAARIGKRLADALAYAHAKGVVHCDIKPANVFMVGRTQPKVLDFGIARVTRRQALQEAQPVDIDTGSLDAAPVEGGSPYYVSPEQLLGQELDARADVYGVGVVLYEMLTGRRAFAGDSLDELREAVLRGEVSPVHVVNPRIDAGLSDIVARAMARKPGDRHRSARQLSRALRHWISQETNGALPAPPAHIGSRWRWAAGATVAAVLVAAAAWMSDRAPAIEEATVLAAPTSAPVASQASPAPQALAASAEPAAAVAPASPEAQAPPPDAAAARPRAEAARHARKDAKPAAATPSAPAPVAAPPAPAAPPAVGQVQLAVTPWGQVEVGGRAMGTTPPLTRLSLPVGTHQIVVRNGDLPVFTASVNVTPDKPVTLRHRFE